MSLELKRQHISTKVYKSYLLYLQKHYPQVDVKKICGDAGLPYEYLLDPNNWVSVRFDAEFTRLCLNAVQQDDFCFQVGIHSLSKEALGSLTYTLLTLFSSTKLVYQKLIEIVPLFNRLLSVQILQQRTGFFECRFTLSADSLDSHEATSLSENIFNIIDNTRGYLAANPTLFGLPPAKVEMNILQRSMEKTVFTVACEYQNTPKLIVFLPRLLIGVIPVLGYWIVQGLFRIQESQARSFSIISFLLFLAGYLFKMLVNARESRGQIYQSELKIQDQYQKLQKVSENLNRQLVESQLMSKVVESLARSQSAIQIFEVSCKNIKEILKYDRCVIFVPDSNQAHLNYLVSVGFSDAEVLQLKQLSLEIDLQSKDPNKASNVFRSKHPILIQSSENHLKTLNDESQKVIQFIGSVSYLCVPIVAESNTHGILLVDQIQLDRTLSKKDLDLMVKVGKQIAIALDREKAKEETVTALKSADKLKDEFLAKTSHELKTPLHQIIGITESIIHDNPSLLPGHVINELQLTIRSAQRLQRLVSEILDFTQLKYKKRKLNIKALEVQPILNSVLAIFEKDIRKKSITLSNHVGSDCPSVYADEDALFQIFVNLISNAFKFTDSGSIEVFSRQSNNHLELVVKDTGIGVSRDQQKVIFEQFRQGDNAILRRANGSGLGLAIVKELADLQKGDVRVESEPGQGALFIVSLPIALEIKDLKGSGIPLTQKVEFTAVMEKPQVPIPIVTSVEDSNRPSILMVDDDEINLHVLEKYLARQFQLISCQNGSEAVSKIQAGLRPDLILLDIMMPVMDGYETCSQIRKTLSSTDTPIVFLTAKDREEDVVRGFEVGGNDYLTKPFIQSELTARISLHLLVSSYTKAISRFVPWEILKRMKPKNLFEIQAGSAVEMSLSVVMADMRGYTSISEALPPMEGFKILSQYMARLSPLVAENHGWIHNIIGDCIMGCFPGSPNDALGCAVQLIKSVKEFHKDCVKLNLPVIEFVTAVTSGQAAVGWIGYSDRIESSAHSDATNSASRIEAIAKNFGISIIVDDRTLLKLRQPHSWKFRSIGSFSLRGKKEVHRLYEEYSTDPEESIALKDETLKLFEHAASLFHEKSWAKARENFEKVLAKNPDDQVALAFLNQIENSEGKKAA